MSYPVNEHKPSTKIIAALGCGVIGLSWVEAFLEAGHSVHCWDPNPAISEELDKLRAKYPQSTLKFYATAEDAVISADFIQESGPESLSLKQDLFQRLTSFLEPHAIVASSTSSLQPSQLQQSCDFAERIVIGHPFNPPHILPLVEVIGGKKTIQETITEAIAFYQGLGKKVIRLKTERPGHLVNRIQAAVWREAIDAVASGQASVADVDLAVTSALGPRWAVMGPFATFHLGGGSDGLSHFFSHLGGAFEALWDDARRPQLTGELKTQIIDELEQTMTGQSMSELIANRDKKLRYILSIR